MRLDGNEPWLVAGQQGETVWGRDWGSETWWPITFVDMDTGLCKIDVCGLPENKHLSDFEQIRVNDDEPIDYGEYCAWQQETVQQPTDEQAGKEGV